MRAIRSFVIGFFALVVWQWVIGPSPAHCAGTVGDLYRVYIYGQEDAERLASLPIIPIQRLSSGFLVIISPQLSDRLTSSGLQSEFIAAGVDRRFLALDRRRDLPDAGQCDVVFQQGGIRICRVNPAERADKRVASRFLPITDQVIPIVYVPPLRRDRSVDISSENLDSLLAHVRQDSIVSYAEFLQSLDGRLTMTPGARAARTWLINKFHDFGYDSVVTDTFTGPGSNEYDFVTGHNVIAYKVGTENPYHHIIIAAHYDAARDGLTGLLSPGADDDGSGVVAVMEIARALSTIDTRQTIVFVLFDAEEEEFVGSSAYVRRSVDGDDRIALMLNMDMIGHYENDHDALIYMGIDTTASDLWATLADSIPGLDLIAHSEPGGAWGDEIPFSNAGYRTLGVWEYVPSTVYHSYRDSTTYLNFDYLTRMARASLATAYVTDQQFIPDYELWIHFSPSVTDMIPPNRSTPLSVIVKECGGAQLVPGSVQLHYAVNGGEETVVTMDLAGGDMFTAELPPLECLDKISYHVTAEDDSLGTYYCPGAAEEQQAIAATGMSTIFEDHFETDQGWTIETQTFSGSWELVSLLYQYDYDLNRFWYTTFGSGGVMNGTTSLISPPVSITGGECFLEYARWCADYPEAGPIPDYLTVSIRIAGAGPWIPVDVVPAADGITGEWLVGDWQLARLRLGSFITLPETVQIKFDATENGNDSHLYAAVDAVRFLGFVMDTRIQTESVPNWTAYHPYAVQLDAASCAEPLTWVDRFGQLEGSGLTLSSDGLLSGTPTKLGSILFRAQVTDQTGSSDEQILSFIIYDTLHVSTASIPSATLDTGYAAQLAVTGGTGTKIWTDRDGDLEGTGVTLSPAGLLSGTPAVEGDFPFTALVTDQVGATTEKAYALHVVGPYVCGDADGDSAVNIGDAVYVINYIFKNGSPPDPIESGDANADGDVNIGDAVYLINFIFKGGPAPQCP